MVFDILQRLLEVFMGCVNWGGADPAQSLTTDREMVDYLDVSIDHAEDDVALIAQALSTVLRAKSMNQLAEDTGIGRNELYAALSGDENIKFVTVLKVARALGVQIGAHSPTIKVEPDSPRLESGRK
jgi:probable addiction module antidote protein